MNTFKYFSRKMLVAFLLTAAVSVPALAGGEDLEGLWEIQGTPDGAPGPAFTNRAHFHKNGLLVNIDPWFGTGLGQWEKTGGGQYTLSFTHYFLDGADVGEVTVSAEATVSQDKQTQYGDFLTEITINGFLVDSFEGTVVGTRQ
ncbi:MAG: hypothetical protein HKN58_10090 [Xanthomonadales bacterium]|nr:hypothetical protein [Xanthomonadales bacterium]